MTTDTLLGITGCVLGAFGIAATFWAAYDARKQRSAREKAVIAATSVIERTYGLLIGIKPSVVPLGQPAVKAIDDGLDAINAQRRSFNDL
ncbi:hypothetical protein [Burkholderia aenigmatica]|uniref:hypothetical protein n=1 Tax=Burkholderia aenigmatica TaxID=2015348 RepID=UPI001B3582B0|nr:hypothetical protein [Burkholderia aenigmatica]